MHRRWSVRVVLPLVVLAMGTACNPQGPAVPNPPRVPITPNLQFSGRLNFVPPNVAGGRTVFTLCTIGAERGHPVPDQPLQVVPDPDGAGNTGSSSAVFAQVAGSGSVIQIDRTNEPVYLPVDLDVPCNGKGEIVFHQCWGIIACTDGSPDVIPVEFDMIGLPFDPGTSPARPVTQP